MGVMPNAINVDPWTLAQKFLDQQAKDNSNLDYMAHQMDMKSGANIRETAEKDQVPNRRYMTKRAEGQADIENTEDAMKAGVVDTNGRYRKSKSQAGDPQFFEEFMDTLKANGVTNPLALAAIAGTGQQESGWSRVYDEWNDPSASGKPGRSGLSMSWREDRLRAAREYARSVGDDPNKPSAKTQAEFFIKENGAGNNPGLIEKLQNAKDLGSAMKEINKAWGFGDNSHGARYNNAANYLKQFGNAPLTAKERATGIAQASAPSTSVSNTPLVDESGKEYFELQMDADGYKKVANGIPNGRALIVPDTSKPLGPKGQMTVRQYTGKTRTPTMPTSTPNIATEQPKKEQIAKARGYDGSEEEL